MPTTSPSTHRCTSTSRSATHSGTRSGGSHGRRGRRNRRIVTTLVGLLALAAPFGAGACGPSTSSSSAPAVGVGVGDQAGSTAAPAVSDDHLVQVARPSHEGVEVHTAPEAVAPVVTTLAMTTPLGSPTTMLVLDQEPAAGDPEWIEVALASRPNGSQGWVDADDVTVQVDDMAVEVSLSGHVMRVTRDGQVAVETPVAIGADATPTPTGRFYVTDVIDTGKPDGAYGPFALGLSAHSDVLDQFAGGDGQIGIHGTNQPDSIGTSASHGCVRVPNEVITALAGNIPLGTPVTITA